MGVLNSFPVQSIAKTLIDYISNVAEMIAPDEIVEEDLAKVKKYTGWVYSTAKFFGPDLVKSSDTDLDDAALKEVCEVCEIAAKKYGFSLNPVEILV